MPENSIIDRLLTEVKRLNLRVRINEFSPAVSDYVVLDVEHDENGTHVGTGFFCGLDRDISFFTRFDLHRFNFLSQAKIIGHNVITDIELLQSWGLPVSEANIYWDTMLMGHIIDSSLKDYSLKGMAERELGIKYPTYDEVVGKKTAKQKRQRVTLDKQPLEVVANYNALDVYSTYKLYERQMKYASI